MDARARDVTPLNRRLAERYVLDVEDQFDGEELDGSLWLPYYLPQWSSATRSAARYELVDGCLDLLIEADQVPWCPEYDGETRTSSLQTGVFSGPVGSTIGQHRFNPTVVVREEQRNARLYTPQFGVFVLRAKALDHPRGMVSLWMIGYEDRPERSAEICVFEIFGEDVGRHHSAVGMGVHPFGDPTIGDAFEQVRVAIDARDFHEYAAKWTPRGVNFFIDGEQVKSVDQSPQYPMQLMLGIYELGGTRPDGPYPKRFTIDWFRAYRARSVDER